MIRHRHTPEPPLSDFVELFWYFEGYSLPHAKERLLPTGTVELVINLKEDKNRVYCREDSTCQTYSGAIVCGAHSEYFVIDTAEQESVVGVHFKPGGAFPFLGVANNELHNSHVSLQDLWGAGAGQLREQLIQAATPAAKFAILEHTLLRRARRGKSLHPVTPFALQCFAVQPHLQTLTTVLDEIALSHKQFIQVFRREVGLTPKMFCRIQRFQRVLRRLSTGRSIKWVDVALDCGYYDQAHFIRDFQAFSGLRPTDYLSTQTEHLNHVPLPASLKT